MIVGASTAVDTYMGRDLAQDAETVCELEAQLVKRVDEARIREEKRIL